MKGRENAEVEEKGSIHPDGVGVLTVRLYEVLPGGT